MHESRSQTLEAPTWPERLALAASVVLHPSVLPTMAFATLFFGVEGIVPLGLSVEGKLWLLGLLSLLTFFLPLALMGIFHYLRLIESWQLKSSADRQAALWMAVGLYAGGTWLLRTLLPDTLLHLMMALTALALLNAVVNAFYRISGHTMGAAAYLGYWAALAWQTGSPQLLAPLILTVLATGIAAWARLTLRAHTLDQVVWGFGVGVGAGVAVGLWA